MLPTDEAAHQWYRFVLSFPPHLVRDYIARFGIGPGQTVLDPFCGTGTTLVECKKLGVPSIGIEANPTACFASRVKTNWGVCPDGLSRHAQAVASAARRVLNDDGFDDEPPILGPAVGAPEGANLRALDPEQSRLLLADSISPLPLHKTLVLSRCIDELAEPRFLPHERLALARAAVASASNLRFGPEVGLGRRKADAAVVGPWLADVRQMARDIVALAGASSVPVAVYQADAREIDQVLAAGSVDAVITSPPYPNEKDYTRTTRLESVLLGFIADKAGLRALKQHLVRSNTRSVYSADTDDALVDGHPEVERIAAEIESRRIALGKTSGFERQYARLTRLYFGGMKRHLESLVPCLRPGAKLAYVVGDQASYLRVMIRTGEILADIARSVGYSVGGIDLFRTRFSTATGEHLREEVVLLEWPGQ